MRLRDAFDPDGLANPGKVFPTPRLCGEVPGPYERIRWSGQVLPSVSEPVPRSRRRPRR